MAVENQGHRCPGTARSGSRIGTGTGSPGGTVAGSRADGVMGQQRGGVDVKVGDEWKEATNNQRRRVARGAGRRRVIQGGRAIAGGRGGQDGNGWSGVETGEAGRRRCHPGSGELVRGMEQNGRELSWRTYTRGYLDAS
jgi:hypothetical protein